MFRTNRMPEDTEDIWFNTFHTFKQPAATIIMNILLSNRTYNIEIVGAVGVGKSAFIQRLLTNTFTPNYVGGAIAPGVIAFPTLTGKVTFNIRESQGSIYQPNLSANTDAFFVMTSYQDSLELDEAEKWIKAIRTVTRDRIGDDGVPIVRRVTIGDDGVPIVITVRGDVPIVLVDLKRDKPHRPEWNKNRIKLKKPQDVCHKYGNIPYVEVSSRLDQNMHGPFIALQNILRTSKANMNVDNPNIPNIPLTPLLPVFQFPPPPP